MGRRISGRECKVRAVELVRERGCRWPKLAESVLRRWLREKRTDPQQAFSGRSQMRPAQQEIKRLRREFAKLKAERDILKMAAAYFARGEVINAIAIARVTGRTHEVRRHREAPVGLPLSWLCSPLGVSRSGFHALADPAS